MCDTTGLAEMMLGLDGFRVTDVVEINDGAELVVKVETTATVAGCVACGTRAVAHERRAVTYRDLECFGRSTQLVWNKRWWRCPELDCGAKTWTEQHEGFAARVLLTRRAGVEATIEVGQHCRPVAELSGRFAVAWETIMDAVVEYGTALVEDPDRVGRCRRLCVDDYVYVARTRSDDESLAQFRNLHKVGYTTQPPAARLSGAANDPTFLHAAADLVDSYEMPAAYAKLVKTLLHQFFSDVRLDVWFDAGPTANEWFDAPAEAIDLVQSGQLANYRYDPKATKETLC